ncbi:MAG: hypothetical protein KAJ97_08655 [Acidobacteria bacterium]|nr:hypothetical protein [Acidobacteriota bacterium]
MAFQRFESRFCAFEGPAEWRVVPGLGMVDDSDGNLDRSVVVMENWVDPPQNASDYLETQKEMLGQEKPETEVIGEQTLDSRQLSEGVLVTFRTPFPGGGGALLQKQLVAVEGPLVCTLTVSGLEDDTTLWNELCNPLLGSFTVPAREWSVEIQETEIVHFEAEPAAGNTQDLPGLGLAVPILDGWEIDPEGVLRLGKEAEIRIRRAGLAAGSAEECFAHALQDLSRTGGPKPTVWQRGETPDGRSFWAVDAVAVHEKTWGPTEQHLRRELFIDDEGVLSLTLECVGDTANAVRDFEVLVSGSRALDPELRRLRLGEPWLPAELAGQWMAAGPGIYVCADPPGTTVMVRQFEKEGMLEELVQTQSESARSAPEVAEITSELRSEGPFRGCDARRYSLDFSDADGKTVCLRTCWLDSASHRNVLQVRSGSAESADDCLRTLLDSFTFDSGGGSS